MAGMARPWERSADLVCRADLIEACSFNAETPEHQNEEGHRVFDFSESQLVLVPTVPGQGFVVLTHNL
jgi:hypothetical protein